MGNMVLSGTLLAAKLIVFIVVLVFLFSATVVNADRSLREELEKETNTDNSLITTIEAPNAVTTTTLAPSEITITQDDNPSSDEKANTLEENHATSTAKNVPVSEANGTTSKTSWFKAVLSERTASSVLLDGGTSAGATERTTTEATNQNYASLSATTGNATESTTKIATTTPSNIAPQNLTAKPINSSSFYLSWDQTDHDIMYNISVTREEASSTNHYWNNCTGKPNNISMFFNGQNNFTVTNVMADYNYSVAVWVDEDEKATTNVTTLAAAPSISNCTVNASQYYVNVTLKLDPGNERFCPPINVTINCTATNQSDHRNVNYDFQMDNLTETFLLENLTELTNYQCYIEISGGNSTNISFTTEEELPSFENIIITNIYKTHVNATIHLTSQSGHLVRPVLIQVDCQANQQRPWTINETSYSFNITHNLINVVTLDNLSEFTNYTCHFQMKEEMETRTFRTLEDVPSSPRNLTAARGTNNFTLFWKEPYKIPTILLGYNVTIIRQYLAQDEWSYGENCSYKNVTNWTSFAQQNSIHFDQALAGFQYFVMIEPWSKAGVGSGTKGNVTTLNTAPDLFVATYSIETNEINEDNYDVEATIDLTPACLNGKFYSYVISFTGSRAESSDHSERKEEYQYNATQFEFNLKPERNYLVNITVNNIEFNRTQSLHFKSPSGVPIYNQTSIANIQLEPSTTEATFTLKREYFGDTQGTIRYLAVIVANENVTGGTYEKWTDNSQWPTPSQNIDVYYQATPVFWNPFESSNSTDFMLGNNTSCQEGQQYCNAPLTPGKTYYIFIRMFTNSYYRNTMPIQLNTNPVSMLGLILGIVIGILLASTLGFVVFILWRKGIIKRLLDRSDSGETTEISKDKFIAYANFMEQNPDFLEKQWQDLEIKTQEIYEGLESNFAVLPENKRKNRYTNVLPFDHTRVKLNIDEDDEICSDYINASYIKGFSKQVEYIATQGPMPHTVRDFWKMVFQENVTIIIMVARFIENKANKCHRYFPNNHETMLFGDDVEVRCSTEMRFQMHCVRTLLVRKGNKQLTITHMQFLEWPDHGVPEDTDILVFFCHQMRERWSSEGGRAIVHCSAGVGRTGTIIATDILTRGIEAGKKLDVFNTVLELRRQRRRMVQTKKQYLYIYQLIRNILEDPIVDDDDNQEHLYQNVEIVNGVRNKIAESAL